MVTCHLHDEVATDGTLLCCLLEAGVEVVLLAVHLAVHVVEGLASQCPAAGAADEAISVVQVTHGLARLAGTRHLVPTGVAHA